MRYYLDTEFDGFGGPLISLALVREDGHSLYRVFAETASDPWVRENVIPILGDCPARLDRVEREAAAADIADFLRDDRRPIIVADWLADVSHLCQALAARSLYWGDPHGDLRKMPPLTFEVSDWDAYPSKLAAAVQHNAWWDAMALRFLLTGKRDYQVKAHGDARLYTDFHKLAA